MTLSSVRFAPDEQAAQQADLARDQLGRAQAERVEAEHGRPAVGARPDDEAVRIADHDAQALRLAADVGRLQRGQAGGGVEIDGLELATDRQPGRGRATVLDDGQGGCVGGLGLVLAQPCEQASVGIDEVASCPDPPDEDRRALLEADDEALRQPDGDIHSLDGRQVGEPGLDRPGAQPEQVLALDPFERAVDVGGVGERCPFEDHVSEREGRCVRDAVDGAGRQQHHEEGACPDRRQAGRGTPHRSRPADGRFGVWLARRWSGRRSPAGRRALGHRGRSVVCRCVSGRAAKRSRASSTIRTHTSVKV